MLFVAHTSGPARQADCSRHALMHHVRDPLTLSHDTLSAARLPDPSTPAAPRRVVGLLLDPVVLVEAS